MVGIDPSSGDTKVSVAFENSTSQGTFAGDPGGYDPFCGCPWSGAPPIPPSSYSFVFPPTTGPLMIAGDGYAYAPYSYSNSDNALVTTHLRLLRVGPSGDSYEVSLGDWDSAGVTSNSPSLPNLITNADQGVLASYSLTMNTATTTTTSFYLATTSGPSLNGNVQVAPVLEQTTPVQPVLQRADGSYVGTVSSNGGNFMIAFTGTGGTLWTGPNDTPQFATADGGVIGTSGTTYDQNGNVTGQIANLPTYSWKGAYKDGDVASLADPLPTPAPVPGADAGGSPTGGGTAVAVHSIGLFWCGSGVAEQGPCNQKGEPTGTDVDFSYAPQPGSDGTIANKHSFANNPTWVGVVENAALSAFQKAYANLPVSVTLATIGSKSLGGTQWDQDYVAKVVGDWPPGAHGASDLAGYYDGLNPDGKAVSRIFYWDNLDSAEQALGHSQAGNGCGLNDGTWYRFELTAWPPPDTNKFLQLLTALGTGIGNAAVHESGHWLEHTPVNGLGLPGMHCGAGNKQAGSNSRTGFDCENENNFVYEFYNDNGYPQCPGDPASVGAQFRYLNESIPGSSPIGWQPEDRCWIARWLNVKDNTCH